LGKQFPFHFEPTTYWIIKSLISLAKKYVRARNNFQGQEKIKLH